MGLPPGRGFRFVPWLEFVRPWRFILPISSIPAHPIRWAFSIWSQDPDMNITGGYPVQNSPSKDVARAALSLALSANREQEDDE